MNAGPLASTSSRQSASSGGAEMPSNASANSDARAFSREAAARPFPRRRPRVVRDFGDPRFGQSPDAPHFRGRRVDILVKSIDAADSVRVEDAVQQYLRASRTPTARCLAEKAVVVLHPGEARGTVLWPMQR